MHRLYELKLLPLLDLLDETDVLQRGPGEVSLLHLQGGVSLENKYNLRNVLRAVKYYKIFLHHHDDNEFSLTFKSHSSFV